MNNGTKSWRHRAALLVTLAVVGVLAAGPVPAAAEPVTPTDLTALLKVRAAALRASGLPADRRGSIAADDDDTISVSGGFGGHPFAVGAAHTCAATTFGDLWCWGENGDGQLGVGTTVDSAEPVRASAVGALKNQLTAYVAAGRAHTCALAVDLASAGGADVYCWGDNSMGQLGDSSTTSRSRPVQVATGVQFVTTGEDHTCVLTDELTVSCWGRNDVGQLGIGTVSAAESTPQEVPGLSDIVEISADDNDTCALDEDGQAWCWGSDTHGQLGDGGGASGTPQTSPVAVSMTGVTSDFVQIDVGERHVCALADSGAVYCWGDDSAGQLGSGGSAADPSRPTVVDAGGRHFVSVAAGGDSSCAIDRTLAAYCWGDNSAGQLGVGDSTDRNTPVKIDQSAIRVSTIASAVLGLDTPLVIDLSVGRRHSCAGDMESGVYCWGANDVGQLGDGSTDDSDVPVATALTPDAPTAVGLAARDRALRANWSAPADLGAGSAQGYSVIAFEGTGAEAIFEARTCQTRGARSCTVSGLANGHRYTALVAALTLGGVSYSEPVYGVPLDASGAGAGLPITGPDVTLQLATGGVLLGAGSMLLLVGRRPRRWY
jgi:alpha-tubulin suppressor-like RCC1 family protein